MLNGLASVPAPSVAAAGSTNQITGPTIVKLAVAEALHCGPAGLPSPLSQRVKVKVTAPVTPGAGSIVNAPVVESATTVPTPATVVVIVPATGETPFTVPTVNNGVKPTFPATSSASAAPTRRPSTAGIDRRMLAWSEPAPNARPGEVGASLTAVTLIVKVCAALSAGGAPSSTALSVIVDVPWALAAGVYVSVPVDDTAGAVENSAAFVLPVIVNVTVWPASPAGPGLIAVAQAATDCAPASSATV